MNLLRGLSHKNIIKIYDVRFKSKLKNHKGVTKKTITYIALELATNGEIFDYVSRTGNFEEKHARYFFK